MPDLEAHRKDLLGYCYRMLGSPFDAEDAVQETMLRAWRNGSRFDPARGPLRGWLFAIATNVCLDTLRTARRRARTVDLAPASAPGAALGVPHPDLDLVFPAPEALVLTPEDLAVRRDTVRLAFVAALQALPPRQRAILILRDVLAFTAPETAALLSTSAAAVNSALQRARAALTAPVAGAQPLDEDLLRRYVEAFTANDVPTLVSLLHEDATMSMPPLPFWLRGRAALRSALTASNSCASASLVRCGSASFVQYRDGVPFGVVVLEPPSAWAVPSSDPAAFSSGPAAPPSDPAFSLSGPAAPSSPFSGPAGSPCGPAVSFSGPAAPPSPFSGPAAPSFSFSGPAPSSSAGSATQIGHITIFLNNAPLLALFARYADDFATPAA